MSWSSCSTWFFPLSLFWPVEIGVHLPTTFTLITKPFMFETKTIFLLLSMSNCDLYLTLTKNFTLKFRVYIKLLISFSVLFQSKNMFIELTIDQNSSSKSMKEKSTFFRTHYQTSSPERLYGSFIELRENFLKKFGSIGVSWGAFKCSQPLNRASIS